jgi:hypothetical protein
VIGVLGSTFVPTGLAGRADPDFGVRAEPWVLAAGALVIVVLLVGVGLLVSWLDSRGVSRAQRPQRGVPSAGPLPLALGTHWALATRPGPASASARSALAAVTAGMIGVVAVVTFGASLDHLLATDRLHGWSFDASFVAEYQESDLGPFKGQLAGLTQDEDIAAVAFGSIENLIIEGQPMEVLAIEQVKGTAIHPTLLEGRAPSGRLEIVGASNALEEGHLRVGDTVRVGGEAQRPMKIVGSAVYPELGNNGDLSHMASVAYDALPGLGPERLSAMALVRVRTGADVEAVLRRNEVDGIETVGPFQPAAVTNIKQVGAIPWVLAGFLALLGLAAVGHALVMSVRGRRREIAVLRAFGMGRGQVALSVAAQASITVLVGALIGIPLGVAVGRWGWSLIADGLGVVFEPAITALLIAVSIPVGLVLANLLAAGPAAVAARLRPAEVLRTE